MNTKIFEKYRAVLNKTDTLTYCGRVTKIIGLAIEASGPKSKIGEVCHIYMLDGKSYIRSEIVGFAEGRVMLMPYGSLDGVGLGSLVVFTGRSLVIPVGRGFIGRTLDALGNPMDGGESVQPETYYPVNAMPPDPLKRERIKEVLPL
ncbi:MAG: EscN/YscN/HrcN family type III secretion system ATPase, partial [Oscillospiraceae bacterium]|nr:EscN/YscN/HrcN family type III secretion system ATPase [Oscillospiraceae bacterium]